MEAEHTSTSSVMVRDIPLSSEWSTSCFTCPHCLSWARRGALGGGFRLGSCFEKEEALPPQQVLP